MVILNRVSIDRNFDFYQKAQSGSTIEMDSSFFADFVVVVAVVVVVDFFNFFKNDLTS